MFRPFLAKYAHEQCINIYIKRRYFSPPVALRPNAGHGLLILEVSRSHTHRRITVGRISLDE